MSLSQKCALKTEEEAWSYTDCHALIQGLYNYLEKIGVGPRMRVAFIARKMPQTIFLLFALFRLKAIACPLSFREPSSKLPELLNTVDADLYLEPDKLPMDFIYDNVTHYFDEQDLATCILTSGSSGQPKAACHTIANHLYNALGTFEFLLLSPLSVWLLTLPLFHVGGLAILFRTFFAGGTVVLSDRPLPEAIRAHAITHVSMVPTQLYRYVKEEKKIPTHLVCMLVGGAPLSPSLLASARGKGLPLFTTYGMTEMSSIITAARNPASEHTGLTLPDREWCLSPQGEILVRGRTLFCGYWDKVIKQCVCPLQDGWFATGDRGEITPEGNLHILGRIDRLFISGGENIHPEEIEAALCSIPGIAAAAVVPIPDPEFGMRPVAFIQDDTRAHTLESIRETLKPLLPSFKHPQRILAYPATNGLKINYKDLKQDLQFFQVVSGVKKDCENKSGKCE